jgi:hypothetical protein
VLLGPVEEVVEEGHDIARLSNSNPLRLNAPPGELKRGRKEVRFRRADSWYLLKASQVSVLVGIQDRKDLRGHCSHIVPMGTAAKHDCEELLI